MHKINLVFSLGLLGLSAGAFAADQQGAQQALERLDSNGDGSVDFIEFQENAPSPVSNMDSDGDNQLSLDEFLDGRPGNGRRGGRRGPAAQNEQLDAEQLEELQAMMLERATARFTEMDLDGNGLVSVIEFQEATFLSMDDDGNGVLSVAELRRRGPGGPGRRGQSPRRGGPDSHSGGQSGQTS